MINLDSNVVKNWKENLAEDFKPKLLAEVKMVLLESIFESFKSVDADVLILFEDKAGVASQDWEPELFQDAKSDSFSRID